MRRGFINGKIWNSTETALLVEDGIISAVGDDAAVKKVLDEKDELIDLNGMLILPGFVDSHMHLLELGYYLSNVRLENCTSLHSLQEILFSKLKDTKEDEWIVGRGYNEDKFEEHQGPNRAMLDQVSKDIPISLTRACGHVMSVNTKAMELAGIAEDTQVEGGKIDYENGIFEENAINLIHNAWPKPDAQRLEDYILAGAKYANSCGITTVGSDDFLSVSNDYKEVLDAFEKLSYQQRLNVKVNEQCEFPSADDFAQFLDDGYTFDVGNDYFRIGPLKLILDGSLGAHTASLSKPYSDIVDEKGCLLYNDEDAETMVALASRFNMPTICHAIGDSAVDQALRILKDYTYEGNPFHSGLVHCQIMRKDQIDEIIKHQYSCFFQTQFIDYDASILKERVGKDRAAESYPYRTLYEGTLSSNGSDAPVELPSVMKGIQLAVTGESIRFPGCSMNPLECLSIEQAVDSYTVKGAQQLMMDESIGKIQEGYCADFAVLDENPAECSRGDIAKIKVMMTVSDGRTVFER